MFKRAILALAVAVSPAHAGHDVTDLIASKSDAWRAKVASVVFTEDFKDWSAHCRSLAKHKGLKIDPGA